MRTVGIYPGTFDPVHPGHVAFALEAKKLCGLDEVVFLPERLPRGKHGVTHFTDRVLGLREALTAEGLRVAELVSEQFTVHDTLPEIQRLLAGSELTLLVGSDVARTFLYRWPGLEAMLSLMPVAIGMRGDDSPEEMSQIMRTLEASYGIRIRHHIVHAAHPDLASTQIRLMSARQALEN